MLKTVNTMFKQDALKQNAFVKAKDHNQAASLKKVSAPSDQHQAGKKVDETERTGLE